MAFGLKFDVKNWVYSAEANPENDSDDEDGINAQDEEEQLE